MSNETKRVFDYQRQTWVAVGEGESAELALDRDRMASGTEAAHIAEVSAAPRPSGAARFLLIAGIIAIAVGGLLWIIAIAITNRAGDLASLESAVELRSVAATVAEFGVVLLLVLVAIHAYFDVKARRESDR